MYRIIALLIGYALGCVQTAYFVGKLHGIDIREHGSKNAGMTNVSRTLGKKFGAAVFLIDMLKCAAAFVIAMWVFDGYSLLYVLEDCPCVKFDSLILHDLPCIRLYRGIPPGIYAGFGAILGHCFPVLLKFRGGKGVSCALALIILVNWKIALIVFGTGMIFFLLTRYISVGSLYVTFFAPVAMFFFGCAFEEIAVMFTITALIWFMHRENIKKILNKTERKFF
ncbi:MAG: glycerol-3-phosphate 1-O-acyltransferase PlsY [Defluviitaleaceae bacterium]|nr:glycerol-3-phosphate 1-O-acyltransferase PlsY [Defluviitaleaceae bacterium]